MEVHFFQIFNLVIYINIYFKKEYKIPIYDFKNLLTLFIYEVKNNIFIEDHKLKGNKIV